MKIWILSSILINIVLASDLLYLYYAGAWYDPIKIIEVAEVIWLYLIIIGSLIAAIYLIRGLEWQL